MKVLSTCEGFFKAENKDLVCVKVLNTCEDFLSREQRFRFVKVLSTCEGFSREQRFSVCEGFKYL